MQTKVRGGVPKPAGKSRKLKAKNRVLFDTLFWSVDSPRACLLVPLLSVVVCVCYGVRGERMINFKPSSGTISQLPRFEGKREGMQVKGNDASSTSALPRAFSL